jgi:hypothetical protein
MVFSAMTFAQGNMNIAAIYQVRPRSGLSRRLCFGRGRGELS